MPNRTVTEWGAIKYPALKKKIANDLFKIKHWKIIHGSYVDVPNQKATWFIDPPYQHGGHKYVHSNKKLDYKFLAEWCKKREGQIIVCENTKADWMDFKPVISQYGIRAKTTEAIWTNQLTHYNNEQLIMAI